MVKKIGGWWTIITLCILILVLSYSYFRKQKRINNALYVIGISEGIKKGVRGSLYLHYYFIVDGKVYTGEMPENFCRKCNDCCAVGDMVQVRYETGNPDNNDLVISIPGE